MSGGALAFLERLAPGAGDANSVEAVLPARFASPPSQGALEELELESPSGGLPSEARSVLVRAPHDAAPPANPVAPILGSEPRLPASPSLPAVRPTVEQPRWVAQEPPRAAPARYSANVESVTRIEMTRSAAAVADRGLIGAVTPAWPDEPRSVHSATDAPAPAFAEVGPPLRQAVVAHRQSTAARDRESVVHVTIDHIDVRSAPSTATAASAAPKRRPAATQSLADYLRGREGGGGGGRA
jgi:hypothetical protein